MEFLDYLENECKGYENRKSGNDLGIIFGVSYKTISRYALELKHKGYPILNRNGYFFATKEDKEVLSKIDRNLTIKYQDMNMEKKILDNLLKQKEELFKGEY